MAAITRIDVRIKTGNRSAAGTDGKVYLAIDGREFYLGSAPGNFEASGDRTYTLSFARNNHPHNFYQFDTADLDQFPVWIRFEPSAGAPGSDLKEVTVTVNPGPNEVQYQALVGKNHLWLGLRRILLFEERDSANPAIDSSPVTTTSPAFPAPRSLCPGQIPATP
jgi:hypothetical protein